MKLSISILAGAAAIAVMFTSCRKSDIMSEQENITETPIAANEWQSPSWQTAKGKTATVSYFEISDPALSTASEGLIIVYKKSGGTVRTLPFEEKIGDKAVYWFYQVSGNTITINQQGNDTQNQSADLFSYVVISGEKLESLMTKGYTYEKLRVLTREEIIAIL